VSVADLGRVDIFAASFFSQVGNHHHLLQDHTQLTHRVGGGSLWVCALHADVGVFRCASIMFAIKV
jgi:hypothetical protein